MLVIISKLKVFTMISPELHFINFVSWLSRQKIIYFVAWGFEKLPEKVHGGDVDMFVHPSYYFEVKEKLLENDYVAHRCPKYSASHKHEQFSHKELYKLHIFDSFCFSSAGKYFLLNVDTKYLTCNLRYKKGTDIHIPSPVVEALFTALRIYGGRLDCVSRLRKFVDEIKIE